MSRIRQWQSIEFRDGTREVPDHLAILMRGLETFRLTYREALEQVNGGFLRDWLNGKQDDLLRRHFRENS